ncbi:hypothetical protein PTKIN_Ptkin03bG0137200 [Pterospermum kingtungense]
MDALSYQLGNSLVFSWNPALVNPPAIHKRSRGLIRWSPPSRNALKFNVDGAARGQPGSAAIEGALWDSKGSFKIIFSKAIGVLDSSSAELRAVEEAFKLFSSSKWVKEYELEIESDSFNVVQ